MPKFKYNSGDIYYETKGEGDAIVLIHGFGLDSRIWRKQVLELSKSRRVITYDMRGFGRSSLPNKDYSHSEDLCELLKHIGISKTEIVGHSFGGEVALEFALNYPSNVSNLILLSPGLSGIDVNNQEWEILSKLANKGDIVDVRSRMLSNPIFRDLDKESMRLITEIINDYSCFHFLKKDPRRSGNVSERLDKLPSSVKVYFGDNEVNDYNQKKVIAKFEEVGIGINIISECGHMCMLEKPESVIQIIKKS